MICRGAEEGQAEDECTQLKPTNILYNRTDVFFILRFTPYLFNRAFK